MLELTVGTLMLLLEQASGKRAKVAMTRNGEHDPRCTSPHAQAITTLMTSIDPSLDARTVVTKIRKIGKEHRGKPLDRFAVALWVQGAMLGTVATTVAVIAVASVGLLMLSGRIDVRRGVTVILGCFILFGAPGIAAGIAALTGQSVEAPAIPADPPPPVVARPSPAPGAQYDPYAGASVK